MHAFEHHILYDPHTLGQKEILANTSTGILSPLHLSFADLSRNRIRKIAGRAFCNLSNLTTLDIAYNKIPSLDLDKECHMPKLQALNISGNVQLNLLELRTFYENLSQLRSLSMADMTNIPLDMFTSLSNLETLNVSGTRLGNETGLILEPLQKLKVIILDII